MILYGSFVADLIVDGKPTTLRGQLTEVFIHRNGQWLHPGWHLDLR